MSRVKMVREGRYIYCVADGSDRTSLGPIGLEGSEVLTLPYRELCAVVHTCPAEPYTSDDDELVKGWVLTHQAVVEEAWKQFGTVLPTGFDTIIMGDDSTPAEENVRSWLREDYARLLERIDKVRGRAEYGVQIFWDTKVIIRQIIQDHKELRKLEEEIATKPKGMAYMHNQKLEKLIKQEVEARADKNFREFYHRIKRHVHDLRVEKPKKADEGMQMVMNLSCLVNQDKYKGLGEELEKIQAAEGLSARFTGPWPPYSFVAPG